ncbi:methyltransferase domain-containing protein [Tumidithrix helvetica PCC 7403]|uniref:class I SAM-dependent methyltransferase n=1 Tax=Tumidithrix helvetica TaxID=3457545 RepID=UPI003C8C009E
MVEKLKPDWAGTDFLSHVVNFLIQTKPLYQLMKQQARRIMIDTAEKKGVAWRKNYQALENSPAKSLLASVTNSAIAYPDYYQVPFHAYEQGNLCWQAALEVPSATYAIALRVWKNESLTWEEAHERLRGCFHEAIAAYLPDRLEKVLDIGCSVGISTLALHRYLQQRQSAPIQTMGLDLSPYMLSVAKVLDEKQEIANWVHGNAERTDFPDNTFDLIAIQFLLHELPQLPSCQIFREAKRILRPGGVLAIVDNNPASPVIQGLPPALFLLMKSTEPWSDEYYTFEIEGAIQQVGLDYKTTVASDPRHRTLVAVKPI